MDGAYSIQPQSRGGSPPAEQGWEQWETRLFALTDQIESEEGVSIEYAYHLAQMRLGMLCEVVETPPAPKEPDELYCLPY